MHPVCMYLRVICVLCTVCMYACSCMCEYIYIYTYVYLCTCMHAWMDGWMDGWNDQWMHACMFFWFVSMCGYLCAFVSLCLCLYVYVAMYCAPTFDLLCIDLSTTHPPIYLSTDLSEHLSVYLSIYLSTYFLCIYLTTSIYPSINPSSSVLVYVCIFGCLSAWMSGCMSVFMCVRTGCCHWFDMLVADVNAKSWCCMFGPFRGATWQQLRCVASCSGLLFANAARWECSRRAQ